jgi:hypothetical protein
LANKKYDKGWPTKVDSHGIDKLKEINMDVKTHDFDDKNICDLMDKDFHWQKIGQQQQGWISYVI